MAEKENREFVVRRNERTIVISIIGLIIAAFVQFGAVIWWGSDINTKAKTAYAFTQENKDICTRINRLEAETKELKNNTVSIAKLLTKLDTLDKTITELKSDIKQLNRTLITHGNDGKYGPTPNY